MSPFFWIGILLAIILLAAGLFVTLRSQRSLVDKRLESYMVQKAEIVEAAKAEEKQTGAITEWISKRIETTNLGDRIARELARADLKLKSGEYVALTILSSLFVGVFGYFFGGGSYFFAVGGMILGYFLPRFYVNYQQSKRLRKFNEQLPDMLNLMVNGLRTGLSALQALEAVSREMPLPINDEFKRVVQEIQLGITMEAALENLQRRIASDDLDLAVTAINIQREVGGNLAEILDTISYTIRERVRIQGEVRSLTAQVKYSGRFLAFMPIILALALWGINRKYMMQFFQQPYICGASMLILSGIMLVLGYWFLNRIGTIEI